MGCAFGFSSSMYSSSSSSSSYPSKSNYDPDVCSTPARPPNPDPSNYIVLKEEIIGHFMVLRIKYPDCENYEGQKILVFKNVDMTQLIWQGSVDPHFSDNPMRHSPIARFVPTEDGWLMAVAFCCMMTKNGL